MGVEKKILTLPGVFPLAAGEALWQPTPPVAASAPGPAEQSTHLEWGNTQQQAENGERGQGRGPGRTGRGRGSALAPLADRLLVRAICRGLELVASPCCDPRIGGKKKPAAATEARPEAVRSGGKGAEDRGPRRWGLGRRCGGARRAAVRLWQTAHGGVGRCAYGQAPIVESTVERQKMKSLISRQNQAQ